MVLCEMEFRVKLELEKFSFDKMQADYGLGDHETGQNVRRQT